MKTNFTLFIAALLVTLKCSAQNSDMNGMPATIINSGLGAPPYQSSTPFSPFVYDSVRVLSEINIIGQADAYPWISADGLRLYYLSASIGNIVFTSRANTSAYFDPPVLANAVFPAGTFSCWFSADELDVYYIAGSGLFYAHRNTIGSAFNAPVAITISGASPFSGLSLDPTQNELYFYNTNGVSRCIRTSATTFNFTNMLQSSLGTVVPGQLSKDGLVFFCGIDAGAGGVSIYAFTRLTLADTLANPQAVQGISIAANIYNSQTTMSDSLEWVVLVSAQANMWSEDELYLAHLGNTTSVFDPEKVNFKPVAFPNPASEMLRFHVSNATNKKPVITIYSAQNCFIEKKIMDADETIDVSKYSNGIYLYTVTGADNSLIYNGNFAVMH